MPTPPGFREALRYPLYSALFARRSRRISKGIKQVRAGSLTYTSDQEFEPLSALEEAMLIAAVGNTGLSKPDRPFEDEQGREVMGTPNLHMVGRSAGSPDNAQATHFFLLNDSGTYFLRPPAEPQPVGELRADGEVELDPDALLAHAQASKIKVLDRRLELPRHMPYYVGSNRFYSNLPGSTVLMPVVDITRQYINGLMFLLTQPDGFRPTFTDDSRLNRPAGVKQWVRSGYLNENIQFPLGIIGSLRAPLEAPMLLQNLMLVLQAMGLGGWIHAAFSGPIFTGSPLLERNDLRGAFADDDPAGFIFQEPGFKIGNTFNWLTFADTVRPNPIGFKHGDEVLIEGLSPPLVANMDEAVDRVLEQKYGADGIYQDHEYFARIYKDDFGAKYLDEVPHFSDTTVEIAKAVCNYIYDTYGRFPAHADAIHVPGVWLQAHHLDLAYYDKLFKDGYTEKHRDHAQEWHGGGN
jgi:hypothetical protein